MTNARTKAFRQRQRKNRLKESYQLDAKRREKKSAEDHERSVLLDELSPLID